MSDERRERFEDLKEAYALGTLPEDERLWCEGYLAEHPELQAEVDELASVANLLALAPPEYEPPPELRRNILSSIEGATDAAPTERSPLRARLRGLLGPSGLFGPGGLVAVAAVLLAVVGLFAWNASLLGENEDLRVELQEGLCIVGGSTDSPCPFPATVVLVNRFPGYLGLSTSFSGE